MYATATPIGTGARAPFSHLFDYAAFAAAFPSHAEALLISSFVEAPASFHIALVEQALPRKKGSNGPNGLKANEKGLTASFRARSPKGTNEGQLRSWSPNQRLEPRSFYAAHLPPPPALQPFHAALLSLPPQTPPASSPLKRPDIESS